MRSSLSLYRERDEVEKKFDELKNELDILPLRVNKIETLQGLLFIFFVSLVIRARVLQKARNAELLDKNSIEDILLELAKLRAVKIGGKWRLTEISKNRERYSKRWRSESRLSQTWLLKRAEFRIDFTMKRRTREQPLGELDKEYNRLISKIRSPCERPHAVIKRVFNAGRVLVTTLKRVHVKMVVTAFAYNLYQLCTLKNARII